MSLPDTVADWVLGTLPHNKSDADVVDALRRKPPGELLTLYFNWQSRLIPPQPREVMHSTQLFQSPVLASRQAAISQIIKDIEHGANLTKYLSRRVRYGFTLPEKTY